MYLKIFFLFSNCSTNYQCILINKSKRNNGCCEERKGIGEMKVGDSMIENPAEVAEHFNSYFCLEGTELDSKILRSNISPVKFKKKY